MKKTTIFSLFPVAAFIAFITLQGCSSESSNSGSSTPTDAIGKAAAQFLQSLDGEAKNLATFPFSIEERFNWHFTPRERKGLPLKAMDESQKEAAMALLETSVSAQGFQKSQSIIELEGILRDIENRPEYRDPGKYYFSIFGDPAGGEHWGWRIEGHHLSLNFSSATGEIISSTPAFFGANPAIVPEGYRRAGWQLLDDEIKLAKQILDGFSAEQMEKVMLSDETFGEIVSGTDREAKIDEVKGVAMKDMNAAQKQLLEQLVVDVYLGNLKEELAAKHLANIKEAGMENLHFAWAGDPTLEGQHYYRIHSKAVLIEFDNSQNNANHVHTIVRDLKNDFGHDALKAHYQEHEH